MKNVGIIGGTDGPTVIYISKKRNTSQRNTVLAFGGTLFAVVGVLLILFRHFITRK